MFSAEKEIEKGIEKERVSKLNSQEMLQNPSNYKDFLSYSSNSNSNSNNKSNSNTTKLLHLLNELIEVNQSLE